VAEKGIAKGIANVKNKHEEGGILTDRMHARE
jgi:hypothetical protein